MALTTKEIYKKLCREFQETLTEIVMREPEERIRLVLNDRKESAVFNDIFEKMFDVLNNRAGPGEYRRALERYKGLFEPREGSGEKHPF